DQTTPGLEKAILSGFAGVSTRKGKANVLLYGEEARQVWLEDDNVPVSFPVNSPEAILLCAISKRDDNSFIVPSFVSDGGAIARNCIVERGLMLVKMQYMSLADFILKTSLNPARMLGLTGKGSLSPGKDADITALDLEACTASMAIARGKVIMKGKEVLGTGGTMLITEKASPRLKGDAFQRINLSESLLFSKSSS
nr:amidohydrolase family protein [Synergistales bacterium]